MRKTEVVDYFGGRQIDVVRALSLSKGTVSQWQELVPKSVALELHYLTDGRLHYDPKKYRSKSRDELALDPKE